MMQKPIEWINVLRGIAVLFVVFLHTLPDVVTGRFFAPSLLALFFFASGYVFDRNRYSSWSDFALRKFKTRIVPYVGFYLISCCVTAAIIYSQYGQTIFLDPDFRRRAISGLFWAVPDELIAGGGNGPLWFLPCLFVTENLFYFISKLRDSRVIVGVLCCVSILAYAEHTYVHLVFVWSVDTALIAVVIYGFGFLANKFQLFDLFPQLSMRRLFFGLVLYALYVFISSINEGPSIDPRLVCGKNFFLYYVNAFLGIVVFSLLAMRLSHIKMLHFFGKQSLIIYSMNWIVIASTAPLLRSDGSIFYWIFDRAQYPLAVSQALCLVEACLILLITLPFVYIINAFFPYIIGGKYKSNWAEQLSWRY
jgi:acyltransferase